MKAFGPGRGASMRAIDTNALVRLIVGDEPAQVEKAEAYVAQGAWVSQIVLAETVWLLESVYGLDRARVATVVAMLVEHDRLTLQDEDLNRHRRCSIAGLPIDRESPSAEGPFHTAEPVPELDYSLKRSACDPVRTSRSSLPVTR